MKLSNAVLLLLTGFAAGTATGMLIAPEAGYKSRRKIMKKAKKYQKDLERTASDYREKAMDIRDNIGGVVHDVKKRFS